MKNLAVPHRLRSFLARNFPSQLIFVLLVSIALNGAPVPNGNEALYLLLPRLHYDASFLENEWYFAAGWSSHFLFNFLVGPLTYTLPLAAIGWLGRLLCYWASLLGLFKLGSHLALGRWPTALAIVLWLAYDQALVAGSFFVSGFEAKSVAFPLLLFSLNYLILGRRMVAAIFLGLTFSFHVGVGLWSLPAVGLSLIFLRLPLAELGRFVFVTAVFALPGGVPMLGSVFGEGGLSAEGARFWALVRAPHHFDPLSWPKRDLLTVYLLLLFNYLHYRLHKDNEVVKLLFYFQGFLALGFSVGLLWRLTEAYSLLKLGPFRMFSVLGLAFFFLQLFHAYRFRAQRTPGKGLVAVGLLCLLSLPNVLGSTVDQIRDRYREWEQEITGSDDLRKTFEWIAANTEVGTVSLLPPWRKDSWYFSRRAQVVCYMQPPFDSRWDEWFERVVAVGGEGAGREEAEYLEGLKASYWGLNEEQVAEIRRKYDVDYFVSKSDYSHPVLFEAGLYKVFDLREARGKE